MCDRSSCVIICSQALRDCISFSRQCVAFFSAHLAHGKSAIKFHHWTLTLPAAERTLFIRATISVGCDKERSAQGLVPSPLASSLAFQYSSALFASILHLQYTPTAEIALPFALR
jgi:hypothetical protein